MKKINILITLIICTYLQSCYKDLGNYDYIDSNRIESISDNSNKTNRSVVLGDTIRIIPIIKWKYPNRDTSAVAFDFKWVVNDSIISKERNLEYLPKKTLSQANCDLYVTEKTKGIVTIYQGLISVSSSFKSGWVILSEKDGKSILSYIRRDQKTDENGKKYYHYAEYKDIYATNFSGTSLGYNPKKLIPIMIDGSKDEILVIQAPDQCVYLSGEDFSKNIFLKDEFEHKKYPNGFIPSDFVDGAQCTYLLGENGDVFWKVSPSFYGKLHLTSFIPMPLYHEGGLKIKKIPKTKIYGSDIIHMYDVLHNRLLARYTSFTSGGGKIGANINIINNSKPENVADINNLKQYELIYMGGQNPNFMMILQNGENGEYILHSYKKNGYASSLNIQITNHHQEVFVGSSLISDNSEFLQLRRSSYLFFSNGSKLYFYDNRTKLIKLYHDFGIGRIIKIAADAPETEIGIALDNGNLYICSTSIKVLAADNPGKEGGILHNVSGLSKIADLIWKYGGYYGYAFDMYR